MIEAVLFDLDSLVLNHNWETAHLSDAIDLLEQNGTPYRLLTNSSLHTAREIADTLQSAQVIAGAEHIRTAGGFLAHWLANRTPRATVFLLGSEPVRSQMEGVGLRVIDEPEEIGYLCDYVVTGTYPGFSYPAILDAYRCHTMDAAFVAVERDRVVPGSDGQPGGGPTAAALESVFGAGPIYTAGMPNSDWLVHEANDLGVNPAACLFVEGMHPRTVQVARSVDMPVCIVGSEDQNEYDGIGDVAFVSDSGGLKAHLRERLARTNLR